MFASELSSSPLIQFSNDNIEQTINAVRTNVSSTLFKTRHAQLAALMNTIKYLSTDKYILSISLIDGFRFITTSSTGIRYTCEDTYLHLINPANGDVNMTSYIDDNITTYSIPIAIPNVAFKRFANTNRCQKELTIYNITSYVPKYNELRAANNIYLNASNYTTVLSTNGSDTKNILYTPLNVRLVKVDPINETELSLETEDVIRCQTCTYTFKDPAMSDWIVQKNVIMFASSQSDPKLTSDLRITNVTEPTLYDMLDVTFKYVGDFENIDVNIYNLFEYIYREHTTFSVQYNLISTILNRRLNSLLSSTAVVAKNELYSLHINDIVMSYHYDGVHVLLILYNGNVYELTSTSFKIIAANVNSFKLDDIAAKVKSFQNYSPKSVNRLQNDSIPSLLVIECTKVANVDVSEGVNVTSTSQAIDKQGYSANVTSTSKASVDSDVTSTSNADGTFTYHVYDLHYFDIYNTVTMKYVTKLQILKDITPILEPIMFANTRYHLKLVPLVKSPNTTSIVDSSVKSLTSTSEIWRLLTSTQYNGIVTKIINPLVESRYNKTLIVRTSTNHGINFRVIYDADKRCFLLFTLGNLSTIVKSFAIYNKYALKHFGVGVMQNPQSDSNNLLFVNPYYNLCVTKNDVNAHVASYMFLPRLQWKDFPGANDPKKNVATLTLMQSMIEHPMMYHNLIMTFTLAADGWKPIRRTTLELPDTYSEALQLMATIYESVSPKSKVTQSSSSSNEPSTTLHIRMKEHQTLLNTYIATNELMTLYALEKLVPPTMTNLIDVIDHESVNGNSIQSITHINNIVVISDDPKLITRYVDSLSNRTPKKHLFNQLMSFAYKLDDIVVNTTAIDIPLSSDNDAITTIINKSAECRIRSVDCIFIQNPNDVFASITSILAFVQFATTMLAQDGCVIIKHLDANDVKALTSANSRKYNEASHHLRYIPTEELTMFVTEPPEIQILRDHSAKLISPMLTYNLKLIFDLNVEMYASKYTHQLEYWYSESFDTDEAYGSTGPSSDLMLADSPFNILIEREHIPYDVYEWIVNVRINCPYTTIIVTKDTIAPKDRILSRVECKNDVNIYIIYPYWLRDDDKFISSMRTLLHTYVSDTLTKSTPISTLVDYDDILSKDIYDTEAVNVIRRPILTDKTLTFLKRWFNVTTTLKPLSEFELTKYVSANPKFNNLKTVEPLSRCVTFTKLMMKSEI